MRCDLPVRVTPRSSRNKLSIDPAGTVRIWVTASPTDNQANEAVIDLLASSLGIAKSRISILRGQTARQKVFRVDGMDFQACIERLAQH